jgi:hypothetical protein
LKPYPEKFDDSRIRQGFSLVTSDEPSVRIDQLGERTLLLGKQQKMATLFPPAISNRL